VTAPAHTRLSEIQNLALAQGLWLPVGLPGLGCLPGLDHDPLLEDLLDHLACGPALYAAGTAREYLLESWAEAGPGEIFHSGAPVFKNVAGFGLHHMLCGSAGVYVKHLAATLQLRPRPECAQMLHLVNEQSDAPDPRPLWSWLGQRQGTTAGSWAVVDPAEGIFLLLAGRDRAWDLGRSPGAVAELLGSAGWRLVSQVTMPFAQATEFLRTGGLPGWACGGPDWSSLAPLPAGQDERGLPTSIAHLRQGATGRSWVPGLTVPLSQWHLDPVVVKGELTLPACPPAGVPLAVLQGLKGVFDPQGRRPQPDWLFPGEVTGV
jgi:hypothetical protein